MVGGEHADAGEVFGIAEPTNELFALLGPKPNSRLTTRDRQ